MTVLMSRGLRDVFLYWWPVIARVAGITGAFIEGGYAIISHQGADAGFLAFCGALIVAPTIFDQQDRRNRRRHLYEDEEEPHIYLPSVRHYERDSDDAEDR